MFKYPREIEKEGEKERKKERENRLSYHSLLGNSVHELRIQSTDEKRQASLASAVLSSPSFTQFQDRTLTERKSLIA